MRNSRQNHRCRVVFSCYEPDLQEYSQKDGAMKTTLLVTLLSGLFLISSANAEEKTLTPAATDDDL
jgi:hypothetical protein